MSELAEIERNKYEAMWAMPGYATNSPGEQLVSIFLDMAKPMMRGTVLDAGCGSGKGALALKTAGFTVHLCDITASGVLPEAQDLPFTEVCLWDEVKREVGGCSDWVYCCDVLEHIPEAFTMLVVSRLLDVARHGLFLNISTVADTHGIWIGETLHHTVKPFIWWRDQLREVGRVLEARDLLVSAAFLVAPC